MRWFLLKLALLDVFRRKIRAILTIGGIAISASTMVFMFGLQAGLKTFVSDQINKTELKEVITIDSKNSRQLKLDQKVVAKIQSISGVSDVQGIMNVSGLVSYNGASIMLPIYAVTPGYFGLVTLTTVAGDSQTSMTGDGKSIANMVLSSSAIEALAATSDTAVGQKTVASVIVNRDIAESQETTSRQLDSAEFSIRGIVDRGISPVAYIPAEFIQSNQGTVFSQLKARVSYPEQLSSVRESIEGMGYQTSNVQDMIDQVDRIFKVIQGILVVFAIVTIAITVFGTINTITIQLVEETSQIGFLRIMGIKSEHVGRLFIVQSVILSTLGVVVGVIMGLVTGFMVNGMARATVLERTGPGIDMLQIFQLPIPHIVIILILSVILGWVIGLAPARRAVKINPLAAIKS
ncbi:MAG TPA: FtsX-like permease family protein [Candidatus Saccharibacteria bacterium]|nr:FtsX-like permease family protein [Candidatus Saccharibacteria bacterium]